MAICEIISNSIYVAKQEIIGGGGGDTNLKDKTKFNKTLGKISTIRKRNSSRKKSTRRRRHSKEKSKFYNKVGNFHLAKKRVVKSCNYSEMNISLLNVSSTIIERFTSLQDTSAEQLACGLDFALETSSFCDYSVGHWTLAGQCTI